ncbi:enoyl-CoA hydratase-related protein [Natrinema sp. SYSU A 869]|uniref:enoyl-CoA hydratase/isomerase family protein n=1 Tax=Natrinema sp. SYSU A 869 TaxID=2871694 RepID=UPI001CA43FA3|nr:enoyl-CoA hydratase-related protein [Natrinema sp. SYSU A 869]
MPSTVDYTVDSDRAAALVTLDRPDSLNTLNDCLIEELCDAIARAEADDEVRVIVLRGAGDEAFSAGYDITPAEEDGEETDPVPSVDDLLDEFDAATDHVHAVWECDTPVIAAVDGYCLAAGSDLAMACDLVIATEESEFGYPGLRMAGVPPTLVYPFVMNLHEAKELLLSGKIVDAQRASELGMVNRVVPRDRLMATVFAEVEEIRKMPGNNVRILKQVLNGAAEMQGAKPMFKFSELFDALGHHTEYGKEYYRIAATEGFDAALEYMNERNKGTRPPE